MVIPAVLCVVVLCVVVLCAVLLCVVVVYVLVLTMLCRSFCGDRCVSNNYLLAQT